MTTMPPFMSITPGPRAVESEVRSNRWNGLSGSNTVSRCPISNTRGPAERLSRVAIRWPARSKLAPSTHRTPKPSRAKGSRNSSPT